jgi:hypothetical protein
MYAKGRAEVGVAGCGNTAQMAGSSPAMTTED